MFVTTGTELTREWHEFERTATAAANAYVGPQVSQYIAEFDAELRSGGFAGSLLLMGSHGGVISAERGCREPITLVESGPVGGCIGAAAYGNLLGVDNLVAFDMGGTTSKCAMIERGRYAVESIYHIGGPDAGFPIRGNVIDILEVGVGGGSIAWLDDQRRLNVGPRSAGSMPGPACYGRGGTEPTVTDANLLLGRLDPEQFPRRRDEARRRQGARGAGTAHCRSARLSAARTRSRRAAKGVLTIANLTMSSIIKKVSIARGYDPRDFALFCYGGGGPLHGIELARALNIPRVIVPPEPGNFSAAGHAAGRSAARHRADLRRAAQSGQSRKVVVASTPNWKPKAGRRCAASSARARSRSSARPRCATRASIIRSRSRSTRTTMRRGLRARFDQEYLRRYGHANAAAEVEIVVLHSLATLAHEAAGDRPPRRPPAAAAACRSMETRPIFFLEEDRFLPTQVYDRYALEPRLQRARPGADRRVRIEHA